MCLAVPECSLLSNLLTEHAISFFLDFWTFPLD